MSVQTDNDILTDEAPQFAARPPTCKKVELLADTDFTDLDVHVLTTPDEVSRVRKGGMNRSRVLLLSSCTPSIML